MKIKLRTKRTKKVGRNETKNDQLQKTARLQHVQMQKLTHGMRFRGGPHTWLSSLWELMPFNLILPKALCTTHIPMHLTLPDLTKRKTQNLWAVSTCSQNQSWFYSMTIGMSRCQRVSTGATCSRLLCPAIFVRTRGHFIPSWGAPFSRPLPKWPEWSKRGPVYRDRIDPTVRPCHSFWAVDSIT